MAEIQDQQKHSGGSPEKRETKEKPGTAVSRAMTVEPLRYLSLQGEEAAAAAASAEQQLEEEIPGHTGEHLAAKEAEWKAEAERSRQEGYAKGRAAAEGERAAQLRELAGQVGKVMSGFAAEQERYFARVEREVVELALAIAARILQREAQIDPLLLAGAVRVALGQLGETTAVQLRVPVAAQSLWSETLRLMPNLPVYPELIADSEMKAGEALLETRLGRVDLGVRAQLKEIERGFFDLLSHREPAQAAAASAARR